MFVKCYVFLLAVCLASAKNEIYKGHKVYEIVLTQKEQQEKVHALKDDSIDFWRKPSFRHETPGLAMVSETRRDWFEEKLKEIGIEKKIYIEDVFGFLEQNEMKLKTTLEDGGDRIFSFDAYYRYAKIVEYLRGLQDAYPDRVEIAQSEATAENNTIAYVKISTSNFSEGTKPIIVVEAGINPREWITVPAAMNVVNEIRQDNTLLQNFDWLIIPVANPDGYEYSHTHDRLWMKSRSTYSQFGHICPGVNIDRNFDVSWMSSDSDSSSSPCSHMYAGVEPFSEVESKFIRDLLEQYKDRIRLYVSIQNRGRFLTFPWNYVKAASGMFRQHLQLGRNMINAMTDSTNFVLDAGSYALEDKASGTSTDYARRVGVPYPLNVDIPQGDSGFVIPEQNIQDSIGDVWRAVRVAATELIALN
ncbi:Carboxypeptidase A2 [Eumeta japonica]|uniref:Carboxypeptidase A2 n=1 Tax=Eumeta variegata TaxID=151549 RepID=A0A4C1SSS2_EUMVA|nr:Carboxypeptidase A2 [Eumeta japonica]